MAPRTPLVTFGLEPLPHTRSSNGSYSPNKHDIEDDDDLPKKPWHHYLPLYGTVFLILAPHPSLLYVLITYHLQILHAPLLFATHLIATYTLTFMAFSSLTICVVRDPGPVAATKYSDRGADDEVGLTEALMPDIDFDTPGRWCRKCWAPKPERTHHCSTCGRCVLKMGPQNIPCLSPLSFICDTSRYIYCYNVHFCAMANNYDQQNIDTPIHELILAFAGIIFSLVIGSFFFYHVYLVS
ncbi:hypothetical protein D9615_002726 [Tricholomella constricta]|uniref:Palmitoyltransferase n=1 Tax=Tricholomella constricta TaxID=117010 RepID=A0A8H5M6N5_9AGAR|nr:hypothetical protein D9615_002726 [Tricholomella constricta]